MLLQRLRADAEMFVRAMDEELYMNGAGFKDDMNTSAIFEKYEGIFAPNVLADVKKRRKKARGDEARKLTHLELMLTSGFLEQSVKELTDRSGTIESRSIITVQGEKMPFRLAPIRMMNEEDRKRRGEMFRERNKVVSKLNPLLEKRMGALHAKARSLGYGSYKELFSDLKGIDLDGLSRELDRALRPTEKLYRERMGELTESIGLALGEAEKHDIGYLLRAKGFDKHFSKENVVPMLKSTLSGLGFDLEHQENIIVDTEERPRKSPRAFCAALEVPDKVMLVLMPRGGFGDYDTILHEAGHAEHYGNVDRGKAMEFKYLGDQSVTETYAFLLQYLTVNPEWLRTYTSMDKKTIRAFLDFIYLNKLYFIRRYSAKLKYELQLHKKGLKDMDRTYKRTLEKALFFKHPACHYMTDLDDGFYSAQYLRAWMFEAILRAELKERFGDAWFADPKAGSYLRGLWSVGQKYRVDEMAEHMGRELRSRELVEEISSEWSK